MNHFSSVSAHLSQLATPDRTFSSLLSTSWAELKVSEHTRSLWRGLLQTAFARLLQARGHAVQINRAAVLSKLSRASALSRNSRSRRGWWMEGRGAGAFEGTRKPSRCVCQKFLQGCGKQRERPRRWFLSSCRTGRVVSPLRGLPHPVTSPRSFLLPNGCDGLGLYCCSTRDCRVFCPRC